MNTVTVNMLEVEGLRETFFHIFRISDVNDSTTLSAPGAPGQALLRRQAPR